MSQNLEVPNPFAPPAELPAIPAQYAPPPWGEQAPPTAGGWGTPTAPPNRSTRRRWWLVGGGTAAALSLVALAAVAVLPEESAEPPALEQPAAVHLAEPGEPTLLQVPGYSYEDASERDVASLEKMVDDVDEVAPGFYARWSVHEVEAAGAADMGLVQLQLSREVLDSPDFDEEMAFVGLAGGMVGEGATVSTTTVEGQEVAHGTADGETAYGWFEDGVVVMVVGDEAGDTRRFVEAYLEKARS